MDLKVGEVQRMRSEGFSHEGIQLVDICWSGNSIPSCENQEKPFKENARGRTLLILTDILHIRTKSDSDGVVSLDVISHQDLAPLDHNK